MPKLSIDELELKSKTVLMRVDFNVPLKEGEISDDLRIKAALPTIKKVRQNGGRLVLCSHLGRPKGKYNEKYSLAPVAVHLAKLLDTEVLFVKDCIGTEVEEKKKNLKDGEILLLENLRFHSGEEKNDAEFAKQLAIHCDLYVNDAFGTAHRAHASTQGVTQHFPQKASGFLMQKELKYLSQALENPARPFVAILGGAKISGKIDVIQNLLDKTDYLLIGGGMSYTFFKSQGLNIGDSIVENDRLEMAKDILAQSEKSKTQLVLPQDVVISQKLEEGAKTETISIDQIPDGFEGADIGEKSIAHFKEILDSAKTVVWNGPMGVFEISNFATGTKEIAQHLGEITQKGATTIIGGGDSAAAVKKFGIEDKLSHVSTGGGASLEFLEGKTLPGVAALSDK